MDILCLHIPMSDIVASGLAMLEDFDCETIGEILKQLFLCVLTAIDSRRPADCRSARRRACHFPSSVYLSICRESVKFYNAGELKEPGI
jgi:hypothetical protein